jgi:hypothetical protein
MSIVVQCCHWLEPLLPLEAAHLHRNGFMLWHRGYQDDFTHRTSEFEYHGLNMFLHCNPGAALLSLRCSDLPSALESAAVWEHHAVKAQQSKLLPFPFGGFEYAGEMSHISFQ